MYAEKTFYEIKYIVFIKNEKLLEKYNKIWNKVSNSIKKEFTVNLYTNKYNYKLK